MPDPAPSTDPLGFIAGSGEMAARIRRHDWSAHPFGPPERWPQSLRSALSICLHSAFPSAIYWGPELCLLYNDAWVPVPGPRHPGALGKPAREVWADSWDVIGPQFDRLLSTGEGFSIENQMLPMRRYGFEEETYWSHSFAAIRGEGGGIAGIFNSGHEVTEAIFAQWRLKFLLELNEELHSKSDPTAAVRTATAMLGAHLDAVRVGYCEAINGSDGDMAVVHDWAAPGAGGSAVGLRLADFGRAVVSNLGEGRATRIDDVAVHCKTDGDGARAAETFAALGARAAMAVPWLRDGRPVAAIYVLNAAPRRWSDAEVLALRDVMESTWSTVRTLRNEQRQALLMREVDHRAKNALAVVQAVVHLSQADSLKEFRKVVEARIAALARAHDLLAESHWQGLDLRGLIERELRPFADDRGRVRIEGPALRLPPELSQTIALALHELATNAAKYGALSSAGGRLDVAWRNEDNRRLALTWRETTRQPIRPPSERHGFGTELLSKAIHAQAEGELSFDWAKDGLKCLMVMPLQPGAKGASESAAAGARHAVADRAARGLPKVLLAEDEPLVAMDLEARIERFGYRVIATVDSVVAAVSALERDRPDVALLDADLHGESSVSAAVELHRRGVPLAFMTGYDRINGLPADLTAAPRLSKPILDQDLKTTIAGLLAG